jgi:thiol:disulfide interchange protein DsbD
MALTLSIVSFSCTGPILGSLLVTSLAAGGNAFQLTAGLAGFGLALALPFGLFAMFPGWLKRLPRSGDWMDTIKKVLAFIELALAFKFLSNADLVMHWGLLKREIFIAIWIFIAIMLSLYLFGAFDPPKPQFFIPPSVKKNRYSPRRPVAALVMLFAIYLLPGLTNSGYASLSLLSGFPPPLSYSVYEKSGGPVHEVPVTIINDYQKALKLSRDQHKPLLIDFTGWTCINCRKMEELVWSRKEINELIRNNYILVSLYVDDRARLPPEQQFIFKTIDGNSKTIRTQGEKWSTFESENFRHVSQPFYVILSPDEKLLTNPIGYTPDEKDYSRWLHCGLNAFKLAEELTLFSLENVTPVCVTAK